VPPRTTAIGSLGHYVAHADPKHYQPTNIVFGIMPPPPAEWQGRRVSKADRKLAVSDRALRDLDAWIKTEPVSFEEPLQRVGSQLREI